MGFIVGAQGTTPHQYFHDRMVEYPNPFSRDSRLVLVKQESSADRTGQGLTIPTG
jgi:hypothetical protein